MMTRKVLLRTLVVATATSMWGCGERAMDHAAQAQAGGESATAGRQVPVFEVDPFWPKPLPDHWILGSTIGLDVDSRDHVFIIHRRDSLNERTEMGSGKDPQTAECCTAAPNVLEFDPAGNVVNHWGGPGEGYTWPTSNHGITIDHMDNVWIGGNGPTDSHILKFSKDGTFLQQFGEPGIAEPDSKTNEHFAGVAEIEFDAEANEAYVADGYRNKRVAVLDAETGELKRFWGAYGNEPDDTDLGPYDPRAEPAQQFRNPVHCAQPSHDGFVYVCDRVNDRIQVFRTDGTFVKEKRIAPETRGDGSVWDIAFSRDPEQKFLFMADGANMKIRVLDRESLETLTTFGDGGRYPGQFFAVHNIAVDSKGNVYTVETYEGKRLQKFVFKGMAPVGEKDQGTPWPEEKK